MRHIERLTGWVAVVILLAVFAQHAEAACTAQHPEIGYLARLSGASTARVDRDGTSIVVKPGEVICEEDTVIAGNTSGEVDFAGGDTQIFNPGDRIQMPTRQVVAEHFRDRLRKARQPLENLANGLGTGVLAFDLSGVSNSVALIPDDETAVRLPVAGTWAPTRIQLYPPRAAHPVFELTLSRGQASVDLPVEAGKKGLWSIIMLSGDQRLVGGFTVVDRAEFGRRLEIYRALGLSESESALALACSDPDAYALAASRSYATRSKFDPSFQMVLDQLKAGGCHTRPGG